MGEIEEEILTESTEFLGLVDADYGDSALGRELNLIDGFRCCVHGEGSGNCEAVWKGDSIVRKQEDAILRRPIRPTDHESLRLTLSLLCTKRLEMVEELEGRETSEAPADFEPVRSNLLTRKEHPRRLLDNNNIEGK